LVTPIFFTEQIKPIESNSYYNNSSKNNDMLRAI